MKRFAVLGCLALLAGAIPAPAQPAADPRVRDFDFEPGLHPFNFDQAFSADNGKTWETNLTIRYTR